MAVYIAYKEDLQMKKDEYAIWGGRFQIIHKGHEYILKYISNNYDNICIGIVNPDPKIPPCEIEKHEKFALNKNPFTYFQRAYLWDLLLKHHGIDAVIVPHWHPRKSLKLESTFLPKKELREWVIPNLENEEYKMEDFQNADETVIFENFNEPDNYKIICASNIRQQFNNQNLDYKKVIPFEILSETEEFLNGNKSIMNREKYIIVPIISDEIDPILLCCGVKQAFKMNKKLIFASIVNVQNVEKWWNFEPADDCILTFYQRYELINKLIKSMGYYDFMILPIIVKNNCCESQSLNAFLPNMRDRQWLFIENVNLNQIFFNIIQNENKIIIPIQQAIQQLKDNSLSQLFKNRCNLLNELDYYKLKGLNKKENSVMAKYGTVNAKQFNVFENGGNATYNDFSSDEESNLKQIIELIINSSNESEIKKFIKYADTLVEGKNASTCEKIINELMKKNIDSEEKKNSFLQKFKNFSFDVSKNLIASLLFETAKSLVFS
jgi:hypothetical protein